MTSGRPESAEASRRPAPEARSGTLENRNGRRAVLLLLLIAAGLAGNRFPISILNAHLVFGSLFAMLALQLLGWAGGPGRRGRRLLYLLRLEPPLGRAHHDRRGRGRGLALHRRRFSLAAADLLYWLVVGILWAIYAFAPSETSAPKTRSFW